MNPNNFNIIEDVKLPKILAVCHRGTQTNKDDTPNSSTHSTKSDTTSPRYNASEESSVKIFEYNQIVQDTDHPEIITIIKDTFSEEIHDHSNNTSQDRSSNRYKYCREVIKPFLKDYSLECQASDDEIVKEVLESVQKDFPDFQACFKKDDCSSNKDEPNKTKNNQKSGGKSILVCDKVKAQSSNKSDSGSSLLPTVLCPSNSDKFEPKKGKSATNISFTSMDTKDDDYNDPYDPCKKPKCVKEIPSRCPEEIKLCKKPKEGPKVPPAPFCSEDNGPPCTRQLTTGCESAEDLKELAKQRKKGCNESPSESKADLLPPPSSPPEQKSIMAAHCEAFETVKQAASIALDKVCQVTKETVHLIRTESARHLGNIRASKEECQDTCDTPPPPPPKKKDPCEVANVLSKSKILENIERLETYDAEDLLHKMVEKMESTISLISEHVDFDAIANILKNEDNSYDKPTSPPQKIKLVPSRHSRPDIVQPTVQDSIHDSIQANLNSANNVFTAIKSKIFSIFSEVKKESENSEDIGNAEDDEN